MELALYHHSGAYSLELASRFFGKFACVLVWGCESLSSAQYELTIYTVNLWFTEFH